MRRALGAGRLRIVRQLLTKSLILSLSGAVVGFTLAWAIVYYLAHQNSIALPLLATIHLDFTAVSWTLVIAIAVGILFGLAPALSISGNNLQEVIKDNASGLAASRSHERFRSVLIISELALACLLLVGAGLLLRSFIRVLDVDLGFNPSHAAPMQTDLPPATNNDQLIQRANFLRSEIDRISALPGVQSVGIADMLPLDRNREWGLVSVGRYHAKDADQGALVYLVTPGYLQAIGMRLREGRDFSWNDTPGTEPVIIINEAGARREWPGEDALGKLAYGCLLPACAHQRHHRRSQAASDVLGRGTGGRVALLLARLEGGEQSRRHFDGSNFVALRCEVPLRFCRHADLAGRVMMLDQDNVATSSDLNPVSKKV